VCGINRLAIFVRIPADPQERVSKPLENQDCDWKPEYLIPRFVADCARHSKYRGIIWRIFTQRGPYDNLVLFDWSEETVRKNRDLELKTFDFSTMSLRFEVTDK
jgi:hypothetical protein